MYKSGAMESSIDNRDYKIMDCMDIACDSYIRLPEKYMNMWLPKIRNQGDISSCTAYAMSCILQCIYKKVYNEEINMSIGGLYGNRRVDNYLGEGQKMRSVVKLVKKYGDFLQHDFESLKEVKQVIYDFESEYSKIDSKMVHLAKSYVRLESAYELKAFLYKYKIPAFVCTKMMNIVPLGGNGLHALACYGYDGGRFYCQNSWGEEDYPNPWLEFKDFKEVWGVIPIEKEHFTDVEDTRWSNQAITEATIDGILEGFPDGTFKPEEPLTREQLAIIWHRMKKAILNIVEE